MAQIVGHFSCGQIITQLDLIQPKTVHQTEKGLDAQGWGDLAIKTETLQCDSHVALLNDDRLGLFDRL